MRLTDSSMSDLRGAIQREVHRLVGFDDGTVDLTRQPGDDGLFGPGSAAWVVHGDFTAMMAGGVAALLLQMLHPGALAGVWDHSNFRADMLGRLRRTAQFISATTYGSTETAERMIARVRRIHDSVAGTLPDGTPYSANDPELLTFVHVAEVASFVAAHRRYRDPDYPAAEQDRYLAEYARVRSARRARRPAQPRRGGRVFYRDPPVPARRSSHARGCPRPARPACRDARARLRAKAVDGRRYRPAAALGRDAPRPHAATRPTPDGPRRHGGRRIGTALGLARRLGEAGQGSGLTQSISARSP